ncbi:CHASE2 domain-containing protein [Algihabitans albus]|uniref:CHASE2 domain-containing protein n=1 Tax=Algihabitans albus TaxID=2164067 RepID=UPI0013C338AC|nr:adenylate/guanylate cyclase domain-containing protein [Algihabitans albus]
MRSQPWRPQRLTAAAVGFLAALLAFLLLDAPMIQRLEAPTLDWRFQLRGPIAPGPDVILILIDEPSLEALGGWPPSRFDLARAVERLTSAEARLIVFDLLFATGGGTDEEERADAALAEAIARAGNVTLGYAFTFGPQMLARLEASDLPPDGTALQRYRRSPQAIGPLPHASGTLLPPRSFSEAAATLGHMSVLLAPDGALRSEATVVAFEGTLYPSLTLQAARQFHRLPRSDLTAEVGQSISLGDLRFEVDRRMRLPVNFYGPAGSFPSYSLIDLLNGAVPDSELRGKAVIVGSTAAAAVPVFVTPYDSALPSVAYTATVLDNLLQGRSLVRPEWLHGLDILAAGLGAVLAYGAARRLHPLAVPLALLVPGTLWTGLAYLAFVRWQYWLALAVPLGLMALAAGFGALMRSRAEQRRREAVARERRNLSRYFSPAVAERLAAKNEPYSLTGQQSATVVFFDIIGFTAVCESLPSAQTIELLRGFHSRVERAVFGQGGTLDKYLGDGALAVFGVPDPLPGEAARALAAAVDLQASISAWSDELAAEGLPRLKTAIGIHHGPVIVGDIGGESRFEFTVLGDSVNVASRLEGLTRQLQAAIVASETTIQRAGEAAGGIPFGFHRHGEVTLRGRETPLAVWVWRPADQSRLGSAQAAV